jgi:3-isopropylmalate/(R)-2-methylmalate dehydratase small subunit
MAAPRVGTFTTGLVPLPAENVDTDQIVPARYLKVVDKAGLADALFHDWRFEADGTKKNPPFVIDEPRYAGHGILVAGDNFGTGSSREHAPWALSAFGIKAIFSTSFADIFKSNALKNGILPIVLPAPLHATLMQIAKEDLAATVTIDLASATMTTPDGATHAFPIDAFSQKMLLDGLDELDYIRTQSDKIVAHEIAHPGTINTLQPNSQR